MVGFALSFALLVSTWSSARWWTVGWLLLFLSTRAALPTLLRNRPDLVVRTAAVVGGVGWHQGLFVVVSIYLTYVYSRQEYRESVASDTLWLLYTFPAIIAAQLGRTRYMLAATASSRRVPIRSQELWI